MDTPFYKGAWVEGVCKDVFNRLVLGVSGDYICIKGTDILRKIN